ncbi:MAG: aldehyde dehydrogenase family protein [Clostridiales Family XIII bacterium]|jgi:acyl-CoA reductase-like NAD-dependent aldehyde dehydrogenase|nr:aldehyde dehydrogenase family protein [Clostridiales Family XIII bacterium]
MKEYKMYIGGRWEDAASGELITTLNPSTGEPAGRAPAAGPEDVDRAVRAARAAFPAWSGLPQTERNKVLFRIAALIREHAHEMALLEGLEHGTPYRDAFGVCMGAAEKFEWSANAASGVMGEQIPVPGERLSYVKREPVGVVGFIIPWNLPTIMTAVKLAPALAVGNTCVLKPPSVNSTIGLHFAEVLSKAEGLPAGAVNVITGPGGNVGAALAAHPDVDMIGFTGSSETGKSILASAAPTVKKCVMELGGNNPVLIYADADVDAALKVLAWRQFNNSGQHCSGPGRYYVHEAVYDEFVEKFVNYAKTVKVGDPKDEATTMGPMVSREHQKKVAAYIESALDEGARLAFGGEVSEKGFFIAPTVLADCRHDMKAARDEIFGPVAVIIKYKEGDDVISLANDSRYGLCAHVWTRDIARGLKLVDRLHVGAVFVNCQMLSNEQPWGTSVKESGIGKEGGLYGMLEFTDQKLICVHYGE